MANYWVVFHAYIDELRRPENFPHVVKFAALIQADDHQSLVDQVNNVLLRPVQQQGIGTALDLSKTETAGQLDFSNRVWVPMHMISHIIPEVKLITNAQPFFETAEDSAQLPEGEKEKPQ